MKKLFLILVVLSLVVTAASAGEWPAGDAAVMSVLIPEQSLVSDFDNNAYTEWIERSCNVDLQFQLIPEADAGDRIALMISGGEKLPDVIDYTMSPATERMYYNASAIMDLSGFFADGLAENCIAADHAYPEYRIIQSMTNADGTILAVPKLRIMYSDEVKYKMWVNEDWLNALGLEIPTTTNDFYAMLKTFKEQDANGNGDPNDEIPFITSNGFGGTATKYLFNAFVFEGDGDMFLLDDDGNVTVSYIQDGWFEALDYCRMLVAEGLLAPESFEYTNEDLTAVACSGDVVGVMTNASCDFMGPETDASRLRFIPINPLTGPEGVRYASYDASAAVGCWHVTSYAEDPELCFRVGDFQFCEEGFLRGRYGVDVQNRMSKEDYLAANPGVTLAARYASMGCEGRFVFYNDTWNEPDHVTWHEYIPYFSGAVEAESMIVSDDGSGHIVDWDSSAAVRRDMATGRYQLLKPGMDVYVPELTYNEEETDILSGIADELRSYIDRQRIAYILGQENDISSREEFIDILRSCYGLDTLLEIANTAYARQYR